jgi:ABC-type enterochelin transport system ATPase subunit
MKTFYEYLEQQNFHETELSANASNANALLGLNGGQKGILFNLFSNLISFHQETIAPIVDNKTLYLSTENNWTI